MCMTCATNLKYLIEKHGPVKQEIYDDHRSNLREGLADIASAMNEGIIDMYGLLNSFFVVYEVCTHLWHNSRTTPSMQGFLDGEIESVADIEEYMQQAAAYASPDMVLEDAQIALLSVYKVCCAFELDTLIALQTWSRFGKYEVNSIAFGKPNLF